MKSVQSFALACAATLLLFPGAAKAFQEQDGAVPGTLPPTDPASQEAPLLVSPAQDASRPPTASDGAAPVQAQPAPAPEAGVVPLSAVNAPIYSIPDIRAHRGAELPYVRRQKDVVQVNLGAIDYAADPILEIGDRKVSRGEYRRRALMYAGGNEVDKHITHLLTVQEVERQVAAGADPAKFKMDEAAVDRKFQEYKDLLVQQARQGVELKPGDPDPGVRAIEEFENSIQTSIGMEAYRQLLAADAEFEKVFMPFPEGKVEGQAHDMQAGPPPLDEPRPDWMPETSWAALGGDEQGRNLRSFVKAWAIDGTGIPAMFKPSILARVRDGLIATMGVAYFFDEDLPDDIFMRVGTQMVKLDELWYLVENKLADVDNDLIIRELLTLDAMKKGLNAAGKWLDKEAFAKIWFDHEQEYVNTLFPLKNIILFRGYTSLDRYREHYRYRQAYNLWRKGTLTDEEILDHYQGGGRLFFERGNILADLAFVEVGTRPFTNASLDASVQELQDFMNTAKASWSQDQAADLPATGAVADPAAEAAAAAGAGPGNVPWFAIVSRQHPAPESQLASDGVNSYQRSQLRMRMAEDELSIFLTGYSLADDVFYHGQKGDVYGPWAERCRRHAWGAEANAGAWGVSVRDFSRTGPVKAFEGNNKDLAYEDYLDLNYFYWAQESLKALLPSVKVAGGQ